MSIAENTQKNNFTERSKVLLQVWIQENNFVGKNKHCCKKNYFDGLTKLNNNKMS